MLSPFQLRLVAVLGLILSTQASIPIFGRQNPGLSSRSSSSSSEITTPTSPPISNTPPVSPSSRSTPPVTTPSTSPPSSNTPPTTSPSRTSDDKVSITPTSTPTPTKKSSSSPPFSPTSIDTALIKPSVVVVTLVRTTSGNTIVEVSSSTDSAAFTSAIAAATSANAALSSATSSKESKGMSTQTRNTIIGVVVGIGGTAIFAGLFIVAWRIWGRKKHQPDESDALVGTGFGSAPGEKPVAGSPAASPFQSTLETYHNPARGNVNASSNF